MSGLSRGVAVSDPENGEKLMAAPLRYSAAVYHGRTAGIRSWIKPTDVAAAVVIIE